MRRHIPGGYPKTLESEIGYAKDICRHCEHLHQRADYEKREIERRSRDSKLLDAKIDAMLAKPCCGGRCGS